MMRIPSSAGGWHAIGYTFSKTIAAGPLGLWSTMTSRNACKTCALGMGGQRGGMVNEAGHFPEFCKKSIQAATSDLQPAIPDAAISAPLSYLEGLSPRQLETMGRITTPLVCEAGADRYRTATWAEVEQRLADRLKATAKDQAFFYVSGRSANEAGFLLQLFARAWGTNNISNCSFYCHQASGVGLGDVFGSSTGTMQLEDLTHTDCLFLIGGNPASNHPRFMRVLMDLRRRGGTVVVINPLREVGLERFSIPSDPRSLLLGSDIASHYVQVRIGGDLALMLHLAKRVLAGGHHDQAFLDQHTDGFPALAAHLGGLDEAELARRHGVDVDTVEKLTRIYAASKASVFAWTMGITHHTHGTDSVRAIASLALLRGMVGRPGAGMLPLRGHSNIQGMGTVGVAPTMKPKLAERVAALLGQPLPIAVGLDTMQSMERAAAGNIRLAWCLGGNLFGANPDATFARQAFNRIDQVVYFNTTLNTGHIHGRGRETWILPVRPRDEEQEPTTQESMFSYVRLSDGGTPRHQGPRSESELIAALAERVVGDRGNVRWRELGSPRQARQVLAATVPGLEPLANIDHTKAEFHIAGRSMAQAHFATASGKAQLIPVSMPVLVEPGPRQVRVMTIRSEGQFNTVVYEDHDRYRGQERRDVIMMNASDRERMGLALDQVISVRSSAGTMSAIRVREADLPPGDAAMYYPEANVLVPRAVDPDSGTPSFKLVLVDLVV